MIAEDYPTLKSMSKQLTTHSGVMICKSDYMTCDFAVYQ